ncbi:hypothetical protein A2U01_0057957 [Trifolium medium]|uniref:Secreted protein n=1 Tax=Trifolium medium TaxID=97028 RepID=A0A392RKZ6_9FABA|nr:hypothetical protein [Trifolium medium]
MLQLLAHLSFQWQLSALLLSSLERVSIPSLDDTHRPSSGGRTEQHKSRNDQNNHHLQWINKEYRTLT